MAEQYRIYEMNFPKFEKKMKWVQKKIDKIENGFLSYKVIDEVFETHQVGKNPNVQQVTYKVLIVELEATTPQVNGWAFAGCINHYSEHGNILSKLPMFEKEIPVRYSKVSNICEHCNYKRNRKDTFILYNEKQNEFKQVGRQCLKDFLGYIHPENPLKIAEFFMLLKDDEFCEKDIMEGITSGVGFYNDVLEWLAMSKSIIDLQGYYTSRQRANDYEIDSTDTIVNLNFSRIKFDIDYLKEKDLYVEELKECDLDFAKKVIEHFKNIVTTNSYESNLQILVSKDYFSEKFSAFLTSAITSYQYQMKLIEKKEQAKEKTLKQASTSEYVGNVGERKDFTLTIKKCLSFENMYGITYFHIMEDSKENVFIWKTTKKLDVDTTYILKGTIKEHTLYNDVKQNIVSRCKIVKKFESVA